ncbi:MAG: putative Zn finger protein, partial [Saprospiraceae bacterium]
MKNSYGNTWWGKQWLNALGNIDYSNRLPRGRTYANKGLAKDILIKGNKITASVQGSRPRPYKVNFTIPKFTANEKAGIIEIVTSNPLHLSRLLNRELPTELKKICDQKGIPLFPNSWKDIEGACSCPDWAVPCKHMASVLYLIANEIDKNPFLIFQLHDFDLFQGLEGIGYTAQGQREVAVLAAEKLQQPYLSNRITNDWDEEVYQQLDFSMIPDCRENLLTILSEKPVFFPIGDFKAMLKLAYSAVSKNLTKTIAAEIQGTDTAVMDQVEEVDILLDEERGFLNATFRNSRGKTILSFDKQPELIEWLGQIPLSSFPNFSGSLKGLSLAFQFARKLTQQSACIPQLLRMGLKHYKIRWLPALLNPVVRSMSDGVKAILPTDILFYKKGKDIEEPIEEDKMPALISFFLDYLIHQHHQLNYRFREHEIGHLFFNGAILNFQTYETKEYPTTIQLWLNKFFIVEKDFVPVIKIDEDEAFGFRVNISIQKKTKTPTAPIKLSAILQQKKYLDLRMEVLRDLAMLSDYFPQINHLVASGGKEDLHFDSEEFVEVLFKILPTIRLFGIKVLLPKALRKLLRPQLSLLLEADADSGVIRKKSIINLDNMLSFNWQIALGDQVISEEEFLKMIKQFSGIIKINDRYVFFDENEIMALIEQLKNPPNLDPNQLLHIALTEDYKGAKVSLDKKTQQLIQRLLAGEDVAIPQGLKATLRPYQRTGYEWLYKNSRIGFGSLIADDMGLGKTLQVITTLLKLKEDGELGIQKALIIVPTTLLTNWVKEINKFAPTLKTFVYHGSNRTLQPLKEADILLTTYGVARSEVETFQKNKWLLLAIDEAQNIKNPTTAQTKAIKKIKAPIKIAMSGTPVENRLSEYWSIF